MIRETSFKLVNNSIGISVGLMRSSYNIIKVEFNEKEMILKLKALNASFLPILNNLLIKILV